MKIVALLSLADQVVVDKVTSFGNTSVTASDIPNSPTPRTSIHIFLVLIVIESFFSRTAILHVPILTTFPNYSRSEEDCRNRRLCAFCGRNADSVTSKTPLVRGITNSKQSYLIAKAFKQVTCQKIPIELMSFLLSPAICNS